MDCLITTRRFTMDNIRNNKVRGKGKKPAKVHITMRVPRNVYDYFEGKPAAMVEALEEHVRRSGLNSINSYEIFSTNHPEIFRTNRGAEQKHNKGYEQPSDRQRLDRAEEILRQALDIDYSNANPELDDSTPNVEKIQDECSDNYSRDNEKLYYSGVRLYNKHKYDEAIGVFRKLIATIDYWEDDWILGKSYFYLGAIFYNDGAAQNFAKAAEHFRKGAEKQDPDACYYIGEMFELGLGMNASISTAIRWYRTASLGGHEAAQEKMKNYGYEW